MGKSVKDVSSLSGVSEKTVRRYLHDNNLQNKLELNNQGGYIIPDNIAEDIRKQYENKILAKEQLNNHRKSQLKNTRDIIFKSLVERDLRGTNPKTDKQLLWLTMMLLDKIDDCYSTINELGDILDNIDGSTNSSATDTGDIFSKLVDIQEQLSPAPAKVKLISATSSSHQLELKVNKWLKENNISPLKIDFQSASRSNANRKIEIVYTALISYKVEE